ncbi:hypothetical protein [Streptomyces sp. NPDC096339]|uniref:hypothetical protein n=1 Tax=Streptomyces sp. NPDC096339 TaxID=3366086 RepID=UPI0037F4B4D4
MESLRELEFLPAAAKCNVCTANELSFVPDGEMFAGYVGENVIAVKSVAAAFEVCIAGERYIGQLLWADDWVPDVGGPRALDDLRTNPQLGN